MNLLNDFIVRAALGGIGVGLAAAPLGCFVVWRRMAYFGEATAHAAILGVALALVLEISVVAGVLVVSVLMAGALGLYSNRSIALDTALGVAAHSALAFGLVIAALNTGLRLDLNAYLFGDILSVNREDLAVIWGGAVVVLGLLWWRWSALLTVTLNTDLAHSNGISPKRETLILTLTLAIVVAVAIKVVGILLISALLIIPPAAARAFSRTPEGMAVTAAGIAVISVLLGLWFSFQLDLPSGPMMVCVSTVIFAVVSFASLARKT